MKVFTTDKIRNVVVLGHSGAGKTSLVSAMNGIATASKQRMTEPGGNNADACAADFVGRSQDQHSGCAGSIRFRGGD